MNENVEGVIADLLPPEVQQQVLDDWTSQQEQLAAIALEREAARAAAAQEPAPQLEPDSHPPPEGDAADPEAGLQARVKDATAAVDEQRVAQAARGLLVNGKGALAPCEQNAVALMGECEKYKGLHYDTFLSRLRLGERDWTDSDALDALCWLQLTHNIPGLKLGQVRNAVVKLAHERPKDLLLEFVKGLPPWDGKCRIARAFTDGWGAADTALMCACSSNLFIAAMARALQPGAQVDHIWIFCGDQGIRKSRAMRALGGEFYAEIHSAIGTTDFAREVQGVWFADQSELDSMSGRQASTIKRVVSGVVDRFVQKFEQWAKTYLRRCVFVGATNEATYWQDATGARRLVPVECGTIDVAHIEANRLQWFAEARHRFLNGETWWEFPSTLVEAQADRQHEDLWVQVLREAIADKIFWPGGTVEEDGAIASKRLMSEGLNLDPKQQTEAAGHRLGRAMRVLGYVPVKVKGPPRARGWKPGPRRGD